MPSEALVPCQSKPVLVYQSRGIESAMHRPVRRKKKPAVKPVVMQIYIDKFEINTRDANRNGLRTPPRLSDFWPDIPAPEGRETWKGMIGRYLHKLWPLLNVLGAALVFIIGRVGVGVRFDDLRGLMGNRGT